jgi:hypothetical protein
MNGHVRIRGGVAPSHFSAWRAEHRTLFAVLATVLALVAILAHQVASNGLALDKWDFLFISGTATTLAGLWVARAQRDRFEGMVERLIARGALVDSSAPLAAERAAAIMKTIEDRAERWSHRGGIVLGVAIAAAFVLVNYFRDAPQPLFDEIVGPAAGLVGGFLVGQPLGRMLCYSLFGRAVHADGADFRATAGHVDGAAGLKPLGDYYIGQALVLAIPAAYLVAWSLLMIDSGLDERYAGWREVYLGLLALAICLELAAFVAPLWSAHEVMKAQKRQALANADTTISRRVTELRASLERLLPTDERTTLREQLDELTRRYSDAEAMPTWPIDRGLRRRVTLGNMALVVPLVAQVGEIIF